MSTINQRHRQLLERQRGLCGICRRPINLGVDAVAEDHILPDTHGGSTDDWNMQLAHASCNQRKWRYLSLPETRDGARYWTVEEIIGAIADTPLPEAAIGATRAMQIIDWAMSRGLSIHPESRTKNGGLYIRRSGVNVLSIWAKEFSLWLHIRGRKSWSGGLIDFPAFASDDSRFQVLDRIRTRIPGVAKVRAYKKQPLELANSNPTLSLRLLAPEQSFEEFLAIYEDVVARLS